MSGGLALAGLGGLSLLLGPDGLRDAYGQIKCGALPDPPESAPGSRQRGTMDGRRVVIGLPPGARGRLPVVILLQDTGGDALTPFDLYAVDRYLAAGGGRFAVAAVDDWSSADLDGALLPYLYGCGLDVRRIGLLGWAAGGAGALRIAAELGEEKVFAVGASAPTVTAGQAPLGELLDIPVWLDCGDRDSWAPQTETMLKGLRALGATAEGGIAGGCHDTAYHRRVLPDQLNFLSRHLGA
ncbi:hypothetical protein GCM10010156_17110 [Planobispora rosea]|uniref:Esterase n=1 Tax=Planobispora rosea TaxID=35762 RepID=A0A8J3WCX6_PLARO|nr:hypothetical protein [Planobispora rosea]GGS59011.1 hypothetical protein GCM10010156_17110 [Planobispora rosea]GIH84680.1 hypothetical protein Pro02_30880 [Planobispora rosea]